MNDRPTLAPIVSLLRQKPGGIALEIGAGTGAVASARGSRTRDCGRFIGLDVAHSMLLQHAAAVPRRGR